MTQALLDGVKGSLDQRSRGRVEKEKERGRGNKQDTFPDRCDDDGCFMIAAMLRFPATTSRKSVHI